MAVRAILVCDGYVLPVDGMVVELEVECEHVKGILDQRTMVTTHLFIETEVRV